MYISETYSTSTLLREQYDDALPHLYTIRAGFQTAGRGQAGNSWESEKDKNLLFSTLLRYDEVEAQAQWRISMLVAVALWDCLAKYLPQESLRIKWPNDIYFGDKKLVGILIENILSGKYIAYSIAGIGVNVNQTRWLSAAPNPISMKQITGEEYALEPLLEDWIVSMKAWEKSSTEAIKERYMQLLYRREGLFPYVEREVSTEPTAIACAAIEGSFMAELIDITPQGELVLRDSHGKDKTYHFKQIRFVI